MPIDLDPLVHLRSGDLRQAHPKCLNQAVPATQLHILSQIMFLTASFILFVFSNKRTRCCRGRCKK